MGGRGASSSIRNSKEITAVYDYIEKKGTPKIASNTKAFEYAINNATKVEINDNSGYSAKGNSTSNVKSMKSELAKWGTGKGGFTLYHMGGDNFKLMLYPGYSYNFKLKK